MTGGFCYRYGRSKRPVSGIGIRTRAYAAETRYNSTFPAPVRSAYQRRLNASFAWLIVHPRTYSPQVTFGESSRTRSHLVGAERQTNRCGHSTHYVVNCMRMNYCSICKKDFPRENLLIYHHSFRLGREYIYYACRPCKQYNIRRAHPEHQHARDVVYRAIKRGLLVRPAHCSRCDNPKVQAHHNDYSKPLDVVWVCRRHHGILHVGIKPIQSKRPRRWRAGYRVQDRST